MADFNVNGVARFLSEEATLTQLKDMLENVATKLFELSIQEEGLSQCMKTMDDITYLSDFLESFDYQF